MECPKCGYLRSASDDHVTPGTCPACGIAYGKWLGRRGEPRTTVAIGPSRSAVRRLVDAATAVPERTEPLVFWGRALLYVLILVWGLWFIFSGINWRTIGGSFLHNVNLPFHEFGHVLFSPFGAFFTILGGSLFQIMVPLILLVAFVIQRRDNFAAAVMLWWAGQNFIDLSPYIADAPYRVIPLIFGLGEEYHDWGNLLDMTGTTAHALAIARLSFMVGSLLILLGLLWGGYILYLQSQRLE